MMTKKEATTFSVRVAREGAPSDGWTMFLAPNIPRRKLSSAIGSYANGVLEERVLGLLDATVFGCGRQAVLLLHPASIGMMT